MINQPCAYNIALIAGEHMRKSAFVATALCAVVAAGAVNGQAQPAAASTVMLLATGGTIAGAGTGSGVSYRTVVLIEDILRTVPGLANIANISAEQIANVPSSDVDEAIWRKLLARIKSAAADPAIAGVVITHGTDTLEETAYFLSLAAPAAKPVVVVGSMRPGTATSADGPENLLDAARVATAATAKNRGTMVVMNDTIFDPATVTKVDFRHLDAFASPSRGPIGDVLSLQPRFYAAAKPSAPAFAVLSQPLPRVAIVYAYAGIRADDIRAAATGAKAVVIAGVGAGGVSTSAREAVRELTAAGIPVVRTGRQGIGDVWISPPAMGKASDLQLGTVVGRELTPAKARILLMLALQAPRSRDELQILFDRHGSGD